MVHLLTGSGSGRLGQQGRRVFLSRPATKGPFGVAFSIKDEALEDIWIENGEGNMMMTPEQFQQLAQSTSPPSRRAFFHAFRPGQGRKGNENKKRRQIYGWHERRGTEDVLYGPGRLGGVGIVRWEDRFNQGPAVGLGLYGH